MNNNKATICPTITTDDPHIYRDQMDLIASFSGGVHIDFSDGVFAPSKMLPLGSAWRSDDLVTHVHLMLQNPLDQLPAVIKIDPDLAIVHAESDNAEQCLQKLRESGVRTGVALLPDTPAGKLEEFTDLFDHVLVFGGHLGYQGGEADLSQLDKVKEIKQKYPDVEIGWDGGINDSNAKQIAEVGVNILNAGGYIKNADDPKKAYAALSNMVN